MWAATIPLWWTSLVVTMASKQWGNGSASAVGRTLMPYVAVLVIANYALIAVAIVVRFPLIFV